MSTTSITKRTTVPTIAAALDYVGQHAVGWRAVTVHIYPAGFIRAVSEPSATAVAYDVEVTWEENE